MIDPKRLEQIAQYAEGLLGSDGIRDLEAALRRDAELRQAFLEYLNLDAALTASAALPEGEGVLPLSTAKSHSENAALPRKGVRRSLARYVAAAAVLAVIALGSWIFLSRQSHDANGSSVLVTVLSADDAELEGQPEPLVPGQRLTLSQFRLKKGSLELQIPNDVKLELHGPLAAVFEQPSRLRLAHGELAAEVGERGKGFTVVTDAGEIVDLGTRFGVMARENGSTEVMVFAGEVQIKPSSVKEGKSKWTLTEGDAMRITPDQPPSRLASVSVKGITADTVPDGQIVGHVTDNVKADDFYRFYGVVPGGMAEGASVYTMRSFAKWHPLRGEKFPEELRGADLIQTFHLARQETDLRITVQLNRPAKIYVMLDTRVPVPQWLKKEFMDTGMKLRGGPWDRRPMAKGIPRDADGKIFVTYAVWRKEVPQAGLVELGPPQMPGLTTNGAMYGIAVKKL